VFFHDLLLLICILFHSHFLVSYINIFNLCAGKKTLCDYVTRFRDMVLTAVETSLKFCGESLR
jgi:hypothetical protein